MKKVLFVCVENSCRSQMAEAFGKILGKDIFDSYSSGSNPSGQVNKKALASMKSIGYDMTSHSSKSLDGIPQIKYDYVITMGCGDACPFVQCHNKIDWQITDPKNMEMAQFNKVRDSIKNKVLELVETTKSST